MFFKKIKIHFSPNKQLFFAIKNIFDFYPDNINLYKLALQKTITYSFDHEESRSNSNNERLEYLGDALLSAIVADFLFRLYPYKNEGFLSEMRAKIVSRASLNDISAKIGLDKIITCSYFNPPKSLFGDAFEAFTAAIYIDKGFDFTKNVIINLLTKLLDVKELEKQNNNFKSQLLEWSQKNKQLLNFKVIEERLINRNKKQYVVRVFLNGQPKEVGCDYNIKGAEQIAAMKTLALLK